MDASSALAAPMTSPRHRRARQGSEDVRLASRPQWLVAAERLSQAQKGVNGKDGEILHN